MENTHRNPKSIKNTKFKPKSYRKHNPSLKVIENTIFKAKSNGKHST